MTMSPEEILDVLSKTIQSIKNSDNAAMEQNRILLLVAAKDSEEFTEIDLVSVCHKVLGHVHLHLNFPLADVEKHYELAAQHCKKPDELFSILERHAAALEYHGKLLRTETESHRGKMEYAWVDDHLQDHAPQGSAREQWLLQVFQKMDLTMKAFKKATDLRLRANELLKEVQSEQAQSASPQPDAGENAGGEPSAAESISYMSPAQIVAELDKVAVGQHAAKRGLANAAAQHLKRMLMSDDERARTDKSNVLFAGPTGCGKTLLVSELAKIIKVPFHCTSATKLTASGYIGQDVQSILAELLKACDFDVQRAQKAIVFIDEIDKKAANNTTSEVDIGGRKIQEELLTIIEGTRLRVPKDGNTRTLGSFIEIDTSNILFIVAGAFVGLQDIVNRRLSANTPSMGFCTRKDAPILNASNAEVQSYATAADFIEFGMTPEFMGRLPKRLFIERLDVDQLERILIEPKKALIPEKRLMLAATTDLRFTRGAMRAIAEEAHKIGTNGRALREIIEEVLEPIVFQEPSEATVTAEMVRNRRAEMSRRNAKNACEALQCPDYIVEDEI